jgi:hypothetical protein
MKRYFFYLLLCLGMMGCSSDTPTKICKEEAKLAIQLAQLVEDESFEDALSILDRIIVKDDNLIKIVPYYDKNTIDYYGDTSPIVIYNQQGEWLSTNFQEDFWTYLQVEESQMGAWQAYLMSQMWHYLPLQWHANYSYRDYLYSQSSKGYGYFRRNFVASWHRLAPKITQEGDKYLISACYWSEFEGLVREYYAVNFENGIVQVQEIKQDVLYKYNCGIMF